MSRNCANVSLLLRLLGCALFVVGPIPAARPLAAQTAAQTPNIAPAMPQAMATLSGTITDADGDAVPHARVTLTLGLPGAQLTTTTDDDGHFAFSAIETQTYSLTIAAKGFANATRTGVLLPSQQLQLPDIALAAATNIDVEVSSMSQVELAQQQLHIEETQRLAGFMPNFYVSYNWKAAPLNSRQKFQLATKTIIDPVTLFLVLATTGFDQYENHFEEYGPGAQGFGKRFGANFADSTIGTLVGGAIVPSILHQDPRYFVKGSGSKTRRTLYALAAVVVCRGDNGKWQPNYSNVAGNLAAGLAANLYYPTNDRSGATLVIQNSLLSVAFGGFTNIFQEFFSHHFTPHQPKPIPQSQPTP